MAFRNRSEAPPEPAEMMEARQDELSHEQFGQVDGSFPLSYAHGNILFGQENDERAALYRINMHPYRFLPNRDKIERLGRFARMAHGIGANFSLYRVNRYTPPGRYAEQAEVIFDEEHGDRKTWSEHVKSRANYLEGRNLYTPELFMSVSLGKLGAGSLVEDMTRGVGEARQRIEELFGVAGPRSFSHSELLKLIEAEEKAYTRLRYNLPASRATTQDLQWMIRRAQTRGSREPYHDRYWKPTALMFYGEGNDARYEPLQTDFIRHANAPVEEKGRSLIVEPEEGGHIHQAMLALGTFPDDRDFPDTHLELMSSPLNNLGFPVDATMHVEMLPNRAALAQTKRRIVDADNIYTAEAESEQGVSIESDERIIQARELEQYLKSEGHPPLVKATLLFAVGADDPKELDRRVDAIKASYEPLQVHRPFGLQEQIYFDQYPLAGPPKTEDYREVITIEQFGALMPDADEEVGSKNGSLFAFTTRGSSRPVYDDPTEASREGRPPATLLAGTLGSGKTIAAELMCYNAFKRGSLVVTVDPKPDHALHLVPELKDYVDLIDLGSDEQYRGQLDPLRVGVPSMREELAHSYLMNILPQTQGRWSTQIRRSVRDVVEKGGTNLYDVIENLESTNNRDSKDAGEDLRVWAGTGLCKLAFGEQSNETIRPERPITTIRAHGLTLPTAMTARADYTEGERISSATLSLLAAFAMRLASDPEQHADVLFDEAWMMLGTTDGRKLLDRLARLGRSQNARLLLATQQLGEVGELEGLIGTRIIFGMESIKEAKAALELLGLDPEDPAAVERMRNYRRGLGIMRDLDNRITEIQVDPIDPNLLDALDTNPRKRR